MTWEISIAVLSVFFGFLGAVVLSVRHDQRQLRELAARRDHGRRSV